MRSFGLLALGLASAALIGCGSETVDQVAGNKQAPHVPFPGTPVYPSPTVPLPDPTPMYPAPHPGMPQIPNNGGVVLHDPVIVTVTFPGDNLQAQIDQFDDQIGTLNWWATANAEYGVNKATSGAHVTMADAPPATMTDVEVEQFIQDRITDGTLPQPTDQTIYALYFPWTTTISLDPAEGGGSSCQEFLGYHSSFYANADAGPVDTAYAVINRCADIGQLTETASHEFTEAATDPHPINGQAAYTFYKDNAWTVAGGEDGDMCSQVSGVTEAGWSLTRVWSNKNAAAGDQPCVPVPSQAMNIPYFNAGVVKDTAIAKPGDTFETEVDCYSFGPLPNAITVDVQPNSPSILKATLSSATCQNGDKLTLKIAVSASAKKGTDYHYSVLTNIDQNTGHLWRGMISVH